MWQEIYNSAIPAIVLKSVIRFVRRVLNLPALRPTILFAVMFFPLAALADWNTSEQQLARKIVGVTGPGTVALTVENRSSLGRRDSDIVQNGLRSALEQVGIHFVKAEQATATVTVTLSENASTYVWVADIRQGTAEPAVVMVSIARSGRSTGARDSMPITLRKTLLWAQDDPILDLAVLEENGAPTHIAVLNAESVSLYRLQNAKWQVEQTLEISHTKPWPLDLRGRLILARDHAFDAYLPDVVCRSGAAASTLTMSCHEGDDPWPIVPIAMNTSSVFPSAGSPATATGAIPPLSGFFAPSRNFFTGVLTPAIGKFSSVSKFYSAAFVPRDKYTLWIFVGVDGRIHLVDGMNDQSARLDWGSDVATVRTPCGAGWQVLTATSGEQASDAVRAYELPDRDPVAVSPAVELPGPLAAMWTEARADSALAIVKNRETGSYEAYRLALACQ